MGNCRCQDLPFDSISKSHARPRPERDPASGKLNQISFAARMDRWARLPINLAAVPDYDNENNEFVLANLVDHSVRAHSHPA